MNGYSPWDELERMRRELDQTFQRVGGATPWKLAFLPGSGARRYPRLNIAETADGYRVEALAPGVDPESFDVSVRHNVLAISGEKKPAPAVSADEYHRSERSVGRFVRSLQLPAEVDPDKVKASYANGILTVTLEKSPAAKPRQIQVVVE